MIAPTNISPGRFGANNLVVIEEEIYNLAQATSGDRLAVTNLADSNVTLMYQVAEYDNHLTTKEADTTTLTRIIS